MSEGKEAKIRKCLEQIEQLIKECKISLKDEDVQGEVDGTGEAWKRIIWAWLPCDTQAMPILTNHVWR